MTTTRMMRTHATLLGITLAIGFAAGCARSTGDPAIPARRVPVFPAEWPWQPGAKAQPRLRWP